MQSQPFYEDIKDQIVYVSDLSSCEKMKASLDAINDEDKVWLTNDILFDFAYSVCTSHEYKCKNPKSVFQRSKENFRSTGLAWPFRKGYKYLPVINKGIFWFKEYGFDKVMSPGKEMRNLRDKEGIELAGFKGNASAILEYCKFNPKPIETKKCSEITEPVNVALSLGNLKTAFMILLVGLLVSSIAYILEKLSYISTKMWNII